MQDYRDIITQEDIDNRMTEAVIDNHALATDGVAMYGDIIKHVDGEDITVRVVFDMRDGEDQDCIDIYTVERMLCADRIN